MRKDERSKRDVALQRVADNPNNNYDLILINARAYVLRLHVGSLIVSGQVFRAIMEKNPNLEPQERRVMGPVMRTLCTEKIIARAGISTRERSHHGMATEWKRLPA